jgi:phosphoglycolate/pyridoxal phosphate phosphatase family enzyme
VELAELMAKSFDSKRIRAVIFDADGVLIHGRTPHPGAIELIDWMRKSGRQIFVLTNNSSTARGKYAARLRRMGFHIHRSEIVTSGYLTARYFVDCQRTRPFPQFAVRRPHIFVVGGDGIPAEFRAIDVSATLTRDVRDPRRPQFVIAGIDRTMTYSKIARAQRAILVDGALFIATNRDPTFPVENGLEPGAGTIVAAIATAVGRPPDIVVGKPHPLAMQITLEAAGCKPSEVLMVGDRLDTDIQVGRHAGIFTVLVLSGVTSRAKLRSVRDPMQQPDCVLRDVAELRRWFTRQS